MGFNVAFVLFCTLNHYLFIHKTQVYKMRHLANPPNSNPRPESEDGELSS